MTLREIVQTRSLIYHLPTPTEETFDSAEERILTRNYQFINVPLSSYPIGNVFLSAKLCTVYTGAFSVVTCQKKRQLK